MRIIYSSYLHLSQRPLLHEKTNEQQEENSNHNSFIRSGRSSGRVLAGDNIPVLVGRRCVRRKASAIASIPQREDMQEHRRDVDTGEDDHLHHLRQ